MSPDLEIVPLDRDDPAAVDGWISTTSTVFLSGAPTPAERAFRVERTADHRITLAKDGPDVVATFRSFDSHLALPGGQLLPVNAVSGVTVLPTHRRRRLLTRMMTADMTRAQESGAAASMLIASEGGIYARYGYGQATSATTWTLHADRARFTSPPTGSVRIVDADRWRAEAPAVYDRARVPGTIDRTPSYWAMLSQTDPDGVGYDKKLVRALHLDADGVVDGVVAYAVTDEYTDRVAAAVVEVRDLTAATDAARADLWQYLAGIDFVSTVTLGDASPADPLPLLLADARAARGSAVSDFLWVRLHDVPAALTARRYAVPGSLVLEVTDPLGQVDGTYRLDVDASGRAACAVVPDGDAAATGVPRVALGVGDLAPLLLGGAPGTTSPGQLRAAGRLSGDDAAVGLATALFSWPEPAWCGTWF